jgi:dTDP-4-amino-4,6-dideoxygalactose transaminase
VIWRCDLIPQYENYREEIHEAISRVLSSGRYILAKEVDAFEKEFAEYLGVRNVVGVANGTDALTLSLMALNIGQGDEVVTTPFTAIPTVSAIIDSGATPVFVDVCEDTFLIDIDKITEVLSPKTKAIVPVHVFGNVVDIPRLRKIIGPDIAIIEDACQAHGSKFQNKQCGSMGNMAAFSFYPTKNLGAYGDGGAVVTNDDEIAKKLRLLRMYGMTDYNHTVIHGINSRLDELQAAILRVKLKYLDTMNEKRYRIAKHYHEKLNPELFQNQEITSGAYSNYHVYVTKYSGNRSQLIQFLDSHQVQTNIYYLLPLHLQEANKYLGFKKGCFANVEKICERVIALTMYPELSLDVQDNVIGLINKFRGY